ncbi:MULTISPECIES: DNA-processing protein DprA [unclassified Sporosarcina]|uniref:DNA-processing protein DprA n=1 Tax=unclassified Sporosarcina TaxID=2647733 RepID=UPI00204223C0|nr:MULTISPECIES: DNA-processing protein DprA [unclassified Sporosarcina]GKV64206.1 DNA processing protein DprA [Sporosarcina sp. NCCP-2331]GLB54329.1 DNA processing protein DprA [Sporosarcina sp. NCCP-2378]
MQFTEQQKQLIFLHYIHPVPYSRYQSLLQENPLIQDLSSYPPVRLQQLLGLSEVNACRITQQFHEVSQLPLIELLQETDIIPIPYGHPDYPKELTELCDPPAVLYVKGERNLLKKPLKVGIIGSRKATSYTKKALDFIVPPLVAQEIPVVSGLAAGADTMAHQAAMQYGGETIAVLGHGFSHMYPKKNEKIAQEIAENHLLLTEYPPYILPAKWTFPMRNRIISGLSNAIVVTESVERSGTMSTVEHALDHGKEIFAVPGAIDCPLSAGPNKLLDEGAKPLWSGFQILDSLQGNTI